MESNIAIRLENVGKRYSVARNGHTNHDRFGEVLAEKTRRVLSAQHWHSKRAQEHDCWAVRGITLDIQKGTRLGIVGRNGAGKSTLLKLISRVTRSTEGRIQIQGKVSSLLEVGAGFHPELTGRENIYLKGSIIGMPRKEIDRQFTEIVEFAEIEEFLDLPIKRYSSGMAARLGFAVASHLISDIIIIDEVLSVGDKNFQESCFCKLRELSVQEGRTVLFVSHNQSTVSDLCNQTIELTCGEVRTTSSHSSHIFEQSDETVGSRHRLKANLL